MSSGLRLDPLYATEDAEWLAQRGPREEWTWGGLGPGGMCIIKFVSGNGGTYPRINLSEATARTGVQKVRDFLFGR